MPCHVAKRRPPLPRMAMLATAGVVVVTAGCLIPCYLRRGSPPSRHVSRLIGGVAASAARRGQYVDSIDAAARALRDGTLVAFPTETVFGLGAHAFDDAAIANVFAFKGRPPTDPLIVHVPDLAQAEPLVSLSPRGRALMRQLAAAFWPGPLTLVAPADVSIPDAVTSATGWVGVRCPAHERALSLLRAVGVPLVAPSANRFGHVSPTRAEHVMADLGEHPILVLRASACCDVGIESTVAKIDEAAGALVVLRRGGVPEAELRRWLAQHASEFALRVQAPNRAVAAPAAATIAPGMLLTHYAPDLPSFLLRLPPARPASPTSERSSVAAAAPSLADAVLIDFGARAYSLASTARAYRDLSPCGDASAAAAALFEALRWAETAHEGAQCVLLPDVAAPDGAVANRDCLPALADRLLRAASGRSLVMLEGGALAHTDCPGRRSETVAD